LGDKLAPNVFHSGQYFPSSPRTGNEGNNSAYRKSNLITRGRDGRFHEEAYSGSLSLDTGSVVNMVPMTGTLTLTADSDLIVGSGTLFLTECPYIGQRICAIPADNSYSFLLVVKRVIDDEHMIVWSNDQGAGVPWTTTVSGLTGWLMPRLYAIESQRGQSTWGNVLKLDRGSYLGVGLGTFLIDGEPLAGTSMTLTRKPSIAILDPLTNTYTPRDVGMLDATAPTCAAVGGGSKMQGGSYSYVVTEASEETVGYGNPSDRADVTIATNDMVAITFAPLNTPNANARILWGTTFADTLGADLNYLNGPWHRIRLIDETEVPAGGGTINIEYYDAEIENNEIVTFNNDSPTDSTFVENFGPAPVWIGCQGQGWNLHPEATSPGPFIVPAKPNNVEAAPLELAFSSSPPETIIGAFVANARIYLETVNKLQIAQSTPSDIVPVLIRPFWHLGFACPEQITFALGMLYGYTVAGPARSAADGDESYIEHDWAADVYEFTKHWNPGQVLLQYDPYNDAVVYFHIADRLNAAGFWTTKWLMYGVPQQFWIGGGEFTDDTKDQIVCGVATVADRLEYLISGRRTT
jgi:hypothetical protein